jgi:glutamyl-tRNA reductase
MDTRNPAIGNSLYSKALFVCGCNHTTAPVDIRERLARSYQRGESTVFQHLCEVLDIEEVAVLSTCNRFEIIAAGSHIDEQKLRLFLGAQAQLQDAADVFYCYENREAVRHIFRVAASLDSLVVGEGQILGQLKDAYRAAQQAGRVKRFLHSLFQFSFQVAKKIKTSTTISERGISMSYVAVQLAQQIFSDLTQTSVLVLGSGRMAELLLLHLASLGCRNITVANRTVSKAHELAARVGGAAITLHDIPDVIAQKDLVVGSLAIDKPLVTEDLLSRRSKRSPLFFIDLGVPRNFAANLTEHEDVYLYDIDDLSRVTEQNKSLRKRAAQEAEIILEYGIYRFEVWLRKILSEPSVLDLRSLIEKHCTEAIESAFAQEDPCKINRVAHTLSCKLSHELLHAPSALVAGQPVWQIVERFLEVNPEKE